MHLNQKLSKIEEHIAAGKKFKAADRLRNLINEYPNELEVWHRLAELYYESGFLDAAGRYWILTNPKEDRIKKCVDLYEQSVNYSGSQILHDITFRGDKSLLDLYARGKLSSLEEDSKKKMKFVPTFKKNKNERKVQKENRSFGNKVLEGILGPVVLSVPVFAIVGLITVLRWLLRSIS